MPVSSYVPDFLTIKAKQIEDWAGTIDARNHLPVLLRRLIHSTGRGLHHVNFPGFDNAQRHGWDGWVKADAATPWVPAGRSGWEFSVEQPPRGKAERDYQFASVQAHTSGAGRLHLRVRHPRATGRAR